MDFRDAVSAMALVVGFAGALALLRTLFVLAYLPFHLALNRRGVSMEAREPGMRWIGPGLKIALCVIALVFAFVVNG